MNQIVKYLNLWFAAFVSLAAGITFSNSTWAQHYHGYGIDRPPGSGLVFKTVFVWMFDLITDSPVIITSGLLVCLALGFLFIYRRYFEPDFKKARKFRYKFGNSGCGSGNSGCGGCTSWKVNPSNKSDSSDSGHSGCSGGSGCGGGGD